MDNRLRALQKIIERHTSDPLYTEEPTAENTPPIVIIDDMITAEEWETLSLTPEEYEKLYCDGLRRKLLSKGNSTSDASLTDEERGFLRGDHNRIPERWKELPEAWMNLRIDQAIREQTRSRY